MLQIFSRGCRVAVAMLAAVLLHVAHGFGARAEPSTERWPARSVTVQCRTLDGETVEDAEIHVFQHDRAAEPPQYRAFGPYRTDERGIATCETLLQDDGRWDVWVVARVPGSLVGVSRQLTEPTFTETRPPIVEVSLVEAEPLVGRVSVPDGVDPRSARVRVHYLTIFDGKTVHNGFEFGTSFTREESFHGLHDCLPERFETVPAEDGRFTLPDAPVDGRVTILAEGPGMALGQARKERGSREPLEIELARESALEGVVLREDGSPAPGIEITTRLEAAHPQNRREQIWYLASFHATTDGSGHYSIGGLPRGTFSLRCVDPTGETIVMPRNGVAVAAEQCVEDQNFRLGRGVVISGCVRDAESKEPVASAHLTAVMDVEFGSAPRIASTRTDAEGRYSLRLPPGRSRLYFSAVPRGSAYPDPQIVRRFDIGPGQKDLDNIDFVLPRATPSNG